MSDTALTPENIAKLADVLGGKHFAVESILEARRIDALRPTSDDAGRVDAMADKLERAIVHGNGLVAQITDTTARHDAALRNAKGRFTGMEDKVAGQGRAIADLRAARSKTRRYAEKTRQDAHRRMDGHDAELAALRSLTRVMSQRIDLVDGTWQVREPAAQDCPFDVPESDLFPASRDDADPFTGKRANSVREVVEDALSHRDDAAQDDESTYDQVWLASLAYVEATGDMPRTTGIRAVLKAMSVTTPEGEDDEGDDGSRSCRENNRLAQEETDVRRRVIEELATEAEGYFHSATYPSWLRAHLAPTADAEGAPE